MNEIKQFTKSEIDNMRDSEFLAYVLSHLFNNQTKEYVDDVIFNRIVRILEEMNKQEMI